MEAGADDLEQASYQVIAFPGRSLPQSYQNMIYSKWMRSLKYGNEYFKLAHSDSYFMAYRRYLESILNRPDTVIRIAVLSDDRDVALGWSVVEQDTLHYVHVQHEQRNKGIGRALIPNGINVITHLTKCGLRIWPKSLPHARFNPFA